LCDALERIPSGVICDALTQDLNTLPVNCMTTMRNNAKTTTCGPAFTTHGRNIPKSVDKLKYDAVRIEMLQLIPRGSIHLLGKKFAGRREQPDCFVEVAHFGDITARTLRACGVKSSVLDGTTRDITEINEIEYPLAYDYEVPLDSIGYWNLTGYGENVYVNSLLVSPGDIVHSSPDGILVIPIVSLEQVYDIAFERFEHEQSVRNRIRDIPHDCDAASYILETYKEEGRW
jgi:regulator of RNase E activity RraA